MAKSIMIQGTMSNAGKSLITAGLCRIFYQDGFRVAPFKSQNMALNSFITRDGLEMGRAQVMQSEAAGIEPSVWMNPILLKPTNDTGSQVIVNGEVYGTMNAMEYYKKKPEFIPKIMDAYGRLGEQYDIIVLEGAGSPAEINLKQNDIVNMGMAKMAKAPVLLVGDIDRGGVFASLYGTLQLLDQQERAYVKGTIINKFRGDQSLLEPGLKMLENLTNVPVIGVVPYTCLDIDDEDSLSDRLTYKDTKGLVDIAVMRFPRISNFTDFHPLEIQPEVSLRYVSRADQFGEPDLVLLPGTKNTMEDLLWMRQNGLETMILKHAAKEKPVMGICGGYQMMGESLRDPEGVEHGGGLKGMGWLPVVTTFKQEKVRTRVSGTIHSLSGVFAQMSGLEIEGYEIHMGETMVGQNTSTLTTVSVLGKNETKDDGVFVGNCCGTYLHGFFDSAESAAKLIDCLLKNKGIPSNRRTFNQHEYKENQYNLLATVLRKSLNMELIYRMLY